MTSARWWLAGLVAAPFCAPAAAAASAERSAPAGSVAVVISPAAEGLGEITLRVAAELSAAGFRVLRDGCAPGLQLGCQRLWPPDAPAMGAVGLSWAGGGLAVEAHVARAPDRQGPDPRSVQLRLLIAEEAAHEPSVVAVRATELVRSGLLAVTGDELFAPGATGAGGTLAVRGFVAAGPAVVQSVSGLGSAWGPSVCVGLSVGPSWFAAAFLVKPVVASTVQAAAGTAQLRSDVVALELGRRWRAGHQVRPGLALAGGAYHLAVSGKDVAPLVPATNGFWTPMLAAGPQLAIDLGAHWALHAAARAALVASAPEVRIGGKAAGSTGWPLLLFSATVAYQR